MNPLEDNKSVVKKKQHDFTQIDKLIINEETPVGKENDERPLKRKTTKDARSKTNSPISSCKHCGKEFSRQWLLQNHIRTHTGERPFKCDICNKAFADKSNLRAHRQTHSGLKPFKCDRCGKRFALKSYLAKHEESSCSRTNNQLSPQTLYNPIPFPHDIFYNLH
uniref:Zinc finger protein n=1 Tax=Rhabditophanes sp. KR3021 TaxID=114890 RepID=A0AC35TMB8_9BILA